MNTDKQNLNFKFLISKPGMKKYNMRRERGASVVEVILAVGIFASFATAAVGMMAQGLRASRLGGDETVATQFASEGIEAVRSIKNQNYSLLSNSAGTGVIRSGSVWMFSGGTNLFDKYTRTITVADTLRDGSGNIVASGGTNDPSTKTVTATVSWNFGPGRSGNVALKSYLSFWEEAIATQKKGMLVYGDGGTTSDAIRYKIFDGLNSWLPATASADVDSGTTNKYLRAVNLYASATRDERVMISRHYNGTAQWIYAQVYNGTTKTWGNVVQLSTWTATTFLDVQNFDGTYLANGDFMAVYSDNTTTPKSRVWNGSTWAAQTSLNALLGTLLHIRIAARSGSNEVMAAFLDSANDTNTEYNNGAGYATANWSARTSHAVNTVLNTKRIVDFEWSRNSPLNGMLVFANSTTDKSFEGKLWTANGSGGGSWGAIAPAGNQTNNMGSLKMTSSFGSDEFLVCNKDAAASPTIVCRDASFSGSLITWTTPTNPIVVTGSDTGIQRSFGLGYEIGAGKALITYSDNTAVPKYKLYDPATNILAAGTSILATTPYSFTSPVRTVREEVNLVGSNMMVTMTDSAMDLYSVVWNGDTDTFVTPLTRHGLSGSTVTDIWYDFVWDGY